MIDPQSVSSIGVILLVIAAILFLALAIGATLIIAWTAMEIARMRRDRIKIRRSINNIM